MCLQEAISDVLHVGGVLGISERLYLRL